MRRRLQNRIAESSMLLPVVSVAALLIWLAMGLLSQGMWVEIVLFALSTYLMAELNTRHALLRTKSRMVSCSFMLLTLLAITVTGTPIVGMSQDLGIIALLMQHGHYSILPALLSSSITTLTLIILQTATVVCLSLFAGTYQDRQSQGTFFYISLLISLASFLWRPFLWLLPLIMLFAITPMRSFSVRALIASLLGVLLPYWLLLLWVFTSDIPPTEYSDILLHHLSAAVSIGWLQGYEFITDHDLLVYGYFLILLLLSTMHLISDASKDKMRVRMYYRVFSFMAWIIMLLMPFMPLTTPLMLPLAALFISPLVAHAVTFTNSRFSNILFVIFLLLLIALLIINILNIPLFPVCF